MKKIFFLLAVSSVSLLSAKNDLKNFDNSIAIGEISESKKNVDPIRFVKK